MYKVLHFDMSEYSVLQCATVCCNLQTAGVLRVRSHTAGLRHPTTRGVDEG